MKKYFFSILCITLVFISCSTSNGNKNLKKTYSLIPLPNEIRTNSGHLILQDKVNVSLPSELPLSTLFNYFKEVLKNTSIQVEKASENQQSAISFIVDNTLPDEAYALNISAEKIEIKSNSTAAGFFYGIQTLIQLMPAEIHDTSQKGISKIELPIASIKDAPRFPYRGAMMDVARNFLPKETVLKFIDMMAVYKLNRLHMHLTDDQGWRIEIKKYPKLTEIGSYRSQTQVGHSDYYWPRRYDGIEHRGFYTQEDIKEIIQYASDRFITVIPEIEMPGHTSASLAAYPQLSCGLGKEYVVRDYFDIFDEVYCPKENTFAFLEDVLTEVIDLFPSHYIHIGGDECPKKAWKKCAHCQALIKKEGLKDEDELQSWFIHRIEEFVNSKGRDIIGWDEILEGGLAPNASVMSWRGEEGGIIAAKQKHNVIMTPGDECYFDHYQEDPEFAPLAMSGFLPLDSVYAYNPLPAELTAEEQSYIIGTQANIWGEYIQTTDYFEYMTFPRLLAMAEVQWTQPGNKDFNDFTHRLAKDFKRLDYHGINASRNFYDVNITGAWNSTKNSFEVSLKTFSPDTRIFYAINDAIVTTSSSLYNEPIRLNEDATVYAAVYKDGVAQGKTTQKSFAVNKATGCSYISTPHPVSENVNKGFGLTDGIRGYAKNVRRWVHYRQDTIQIDLALSRPQTISNVASSFVWRPVNYTWPARKLTVFSSLDGKTYTKRAAKELKYDFSPTEGTRFPVSISFPTSEAKYVRLEILSWGVIPDGYYRAGEQSKTALDEIEIH
ncbi:hexosaminidase [Saccharicrinis carchari]|uniref:beta-N-acetylhexosaminidase n=2 Tax=Saccharicrinis carchari TaxID=1168039 RepID=A0A521AAY7_SACCC|nr:hexosaminidase [Saccharicrinis carchari]